MVDQMTPRWQWSFVTCANLVISTVAYAQPPLTIDSAVAQALIHNVGMAQTRATVAGKQEDLRAAQLMDRPTVGVELTALRGSGDRLGPDGRRCDRRRQLPRCRVRHFEGVRVADDRSRQGQES